MERGEAAASGLDLLTPLDLDIVRWNRDGATPAEVLGHVLSRAFQLSGLSPGRLALAGSISAGELVGACELLTRKGWSFVPGEQMASQLRRSKNTEQLKAIRRSAEGVCRAFRHIASLLSSAEKQEGQLLLAKHPLTVGRLRQEVARVFAEEGLTQPEGSILAPAEEGAMPHSPGNNERILRTGESLIVDLFPKNRLFADCTRTFCVGTPPAALRQAHSLVRHGLKLAHEGARPGVRGFDLQLQVAKHFEAAGFPTQITDRTTTRGYVHGLGHGVGFEVHEPPSFREEASEEEGRLQDGDVITLEPGLYEPEEGWAVRLEDMLLVTAEGVENLTPLPYELDPQLW
jgi:Xaa-Pro aminopeptidase